MEINKLFKHDIDLIDGLLALTDSARRILLSVKRSGFDFEPPTYEQKSKMRSMGIRYTRHVTRYDAKKLIDQRYQSALLSLIDKGP